jgi:hypothetical protein
MSEDANPVARARYVVNTCIQFVVEGLSPHGDPMPQPLALSEANRS